MSQDRITIIAEAGVNHNGDLDMAIMLVDAAASAGADFVKFQTFKAASLVVPTAEKAAYQKEVTGIKESQFEMLKKLELSEQDHVTLAGYCKDKNIGFLSTPFDLDSLAFLVDRLKLDTVKIPSGEITNGPLLLAASRYHCKLILSTGMSTLGEVKDALSVIAYGFVDKKNQNPTAEVLEEAYASDEARQMLHEKVTLLHCTTEYPAPLDEINLKAMDTLHEAFDCKAGLSDHSEGILVPIAAAARGAVLIEKHFTLDKNQPGPDHKASLEPDELANMVKSIRDVERILGTSEKGITPSEQKNREIVRRSIVAAKNISRGEILTLDNLAAKRPARGVSPMHFWDYLGKKSNRDYVADECIDL
jgi:N-acetylneuraminate synthase